MKNIAQISFLFFLSALHLTAVAQQNLVPNPSFEARSGCPQFNGDVDGTCNDWTSFRGTPDYFNNCSSLCGYYNSFGYQLPRTGDAYAGFFTYSINNNGITLPYAGEQLGAELISPLVVGERYYVSFYVSTGYDGTARNIATNKMGARFTTRQYGSDPNGTSILPNDCQIYTNTIIADTVNWIKISDTFVADSAYRYVIIGGFFDQLHIDTINLPYLPSFMPQQSYYYLDDVCVSTDAVLCGIDIATCDFVLPTAFTPNDDNRNDKYKWVQNCSNITEFTMRIYNRWGELVFSTNDSNAGWNGEYQGKEQPADVYAVYVLVVSGGKRYAKSASVTLLR